MKKDLSQGNVTKALLLFAMPMILGNLLQQFYNIADTLIVGRFLGPDALAAVGSAYTLMTFLTSVIIGLCMGSGSVFSFYFGKKDEENFRRSIHAAFWEIGAVSLVLTALVFFLEKQILWFLRIPAELLELMHSYVHVIFGGIFFIFLFNYFAYLLRAVGNSVVPLYFLGISSVVNVLLDLLFVVKLGRGISGAAEATVLSQMLAGLGVLAYVGIREPSLRLRVSEIKNSVMAVKEITHYSVAASLQQSVMNFGILMIQGLVNSFGSAVMAAFAAAVKIDTFAYMPAQEFGNAYSIFISQNHGAGKEERIKQGTKRAFVISGVFCVLISVLVWNFAGSLVQVFMEKGAPGAEEIIAIGTGYLRIEGSCYVGIGILFLLYGYFRGIGRPMISLLLTVISLGTRVALAYLLAPVENIGVLGIWWAIPIGWLLADITGLCLIKITGVTKRLAKA